MKNKLIILLVVVNIFLTGSRLSVGMLIPTLFLCIIAQTRNGLHKTGIFLGVSIPILCIIIFVFRNVSFVRSFLCTLFSAIDSVFNTNYAPSFGANEKILNDSSHYRELLYKYTIFSDWLNPIMGRGGNYNFHIFVEGYDIQSVDNFYVGQYITYAWPGLIAWLCMSFSFFWKASVGWLKNRDSIMWLMMISIIFYFISLWYLDQLITFPIMFALFALIYINSLEKI